MSRPQMSITHLPRHILCEQVLPHLSLADIRSVWRTSTVFQCIVREFLKWPSQRTSRNLHSVVVSSMLLFVDMSATGCSPRVDNSRTRSNLREHIAMIGHHLLNRIEVWGNGEECILNVLADIAGQNCVEILRRQFGEHFCFDEECSVQTWFQSLCSIFASLPPIAVGVVVAQVLGIMHTTVYKRTLCAAAAVEQYSRNVYASMYKTFVFVLTLIESWKTVGTAGTRVSASEMSSKRRGIYAGLLLTCLTPKWGAETTTELLLVLKQQRGWTFVEDLLVDMQMFTSLPTMASVLSRMPVHCVARSFVRSRMQFGLEAHVLCEYMWMVTATWTDEKRARLLSQLSTVGIE